MHLKRNVTFIYLLALVSLKSFSQIFANWNSTYKVGTLIEYSENTRLRTAAWGLNFEILPGGKNYFALNYRFLIGVSSIDRLYVHSTIGGAGAAGVIIAASKSNSDGSAIGYVAAFLVIIPEGVTFYFNPKKKTVAGMYINPLSCDYYYKSSKDKGFSYAPEIGSKLLIKTNERIGIQTHLGLKFGLNQTVIDPPVFLNFGIGITLHNL